MPRWNLIISLRWLLSRVGFIYIVAFLFCLVFVDFKTLDERTKIRHLNDSIPDFSDLVLFSRGKALRDDTEWQRYANYFKLVLSYMPDDALTKQLLGFVEYYFGHEGRAIDLFKNSSDIKGQGLFWSNYNLGLIYYKKGDWSQAADYLFKTIASNPKLTGFLMQNSTVYRQIFASPFFRFSLEADLHEAQGRAYVLLLSSLAHLGQYEKMFLVSKVAVSNPDLPYKDVFYADAGIACDNMGRPQEALLFFEKSLSLQKSNPDVYYDMATLYGRLGQSQQAAQFLQASYALHLKDKGTFPYEAHFN
ncbi:MAG: tetratricopeptide repeat protein, partial [Candidatus Omnitrophica bacterium]|nr:tetratricopeptide repeat protein [Candidatus Omnitrophota bacterium]